MESSVSTIQQGLFLLSALSTRTDECEVKLREESRSSASQLELFLPSEKLPPNTDDLNAEAFEVLRQYQDSCPLLVHENSDTKRKIIIGNPQNSDVDTLVFEGSDALASQVALFAQLRPRPYSRQQIAMAIVCLGMIPKPGTARNGTKGRHVAIREASRRFEISCDMLNKASRLFYQSEEYAKQVLSGELTIRGGLNQLRKEEVSEYFVESVNSEDAENEREEEMIAEDATPLISFKRPGGSTIAPVIAPVVVPALAPAGDKKSPIETEEDSSEGLNQEDQSIEIEQNSEPTVPYEIRLTDGRGRSNRSGVTQKGTHDAKGKKVKDAPKFVAAVELFDELTALYKTQYQSLRRANSLIPHEVLRGMFKAAILGQEQVELDRPAHVCPHCEGRDIEEYDCWVCENKGYLRANEEPKASDDPLFADDDKQWKEKWAELKKK